MDLDLGKFELVFISSKSYRPYEHKAGQILGLRPANERRRYFVTTSPIGWVQAENQPWHD